MKTLVVTVEDEVVAKLARVAPEHSQQQSEFVSMALRKALWELEERETAEAYARQPDSAEDSYVDKDAWGEDADR
jgi:metal-responsive CopG/Arc/MetJ family transcriptional regulator